LGKQANTQLIVRKVLIPNWRSTERKKKSTIVNNVGEMGEGNKSLIDQDSFESRTSSRPGKKLRGRGKRYKKEKQQK